jgi:hypothetical protein
MVATLRQDVIPNTQGEYARGQAFGIIYILNSMRLRSGWSTAFLVEPLAALQEYADQIAALGGLPGDAPAPVKVAGATDADAMERVRDEGDRQVCAMLDWLQTADAVSVATRAAINAAIDAYMKRQIRYEITMLAPAMFEEISLGRDKGE